jgi:ankyrin repeat protein
MTPLHPGIVAGSASVVSFMVDHDADVNAKDNDGMSVVSLSLVFENEEISDILREAGALY